jgi:hypothetical protein
MYSRMGIVICTDHISRDRGITEVSPCHPHHYSKAEIPGSHQPIHQVLEPGTPSSALAFDSMMLHHHHQCPPQQGSPSMARSAPPHLSHTSAVSASLVSRLASPHPHRLFLARGKVGYVVKRQRRNWRRAWLRTMMMYIGFGGGDVVA